MALALDIELVRVSVYHRRTECGAGFSAAIRGEGVTRENAVRAALLALGGVVYEDLLVGMIPFARHRAQSASVLEGETPDDLSEAYRFADMLDGPDATPRNIARLVSRAADILRRNRAATDAIAAELRQVRTMSGDDVRAVWTAHGGCRDSGAEDPL
jgi:hypothetical protein